MTTHAPTTSQDDDAPLLRDCLALHTGPLRGKTYLIDVLPAEQETP